MQAYFLEGQGAPAASPAPPSRPRPQSAAMRAVLLLAVLALAACASAVEFGLYDHGAAPGGGWRIALAVALADTG